MLVCTLSLPLFWPSLSGREREFPSCTQGHKHLCPRQCLAPTACTGSVQPASQAAQLLGQPHTGSPSLLALFIVAPGHGSLSNPSSSFNPGLPSAIPSTSSLLGGDAGSLAASGVPCPSLAIWPGPPWYKNAVRDRNGKCEREVKR